MHSIIISQKPARLLTDDDAVHRNVSSTVIREVQQTKYSIRFGKDRVENCIEISVDTQPKITFSKQKYDRP